MTIYKYPFTPADVVEVMLPQGAEILHCAFQPSTQQWCLWAMVYPSLPLKPRLIRMAGTGHEIQSALGRFINTCVCHDGMLVFHFFEVGD